MLDIAAAVSAAIDGIGKAGRAAIEGDIDALRQVAGELEEYGITALDEVVETLTRRTKPKTSSVNALQRAPPCCTVITPVATPSWIQKIRLQRGGVFCLRLDDFRPQHASSPLFKRAKRRFEIKNCSTTVLNHSCIAAGLRAALP